MSAAKQDFGAPPELAWLPIAKLTVDARYQRDTSSRRSRHLIDKIVAGFRWPRFGAVLAVKIGKAKDPAWHVIDGQHRVEAARQLNIPHVPAVVLPHATIEEAAADFVAVNRDRVAVTPLHIHHAMLAARDADAVTIDEVCKVAGVIVCRYPVPVDKMKPGETLAVQTIGRLVKLQGASGATRALAVLREAYPNVAGAHTAQFIRATAILLGGGMAPAAVKKALAAAPQDTLLRAAARRSEVGTLDRLVAELKHRGGGDTPTKPQPVRPTAHADIEWASPPTPQPRRHTAGQFDVSAAQRTRVRALRKAGWPVRDIARDVGLSVEDVQAIIDEGRT